VIPKEVMEASVILVFKGTNCYNINEVLALEKKYKNKIKKLKRKIIIKKLIGEKYLLK